MGWTLCFSAILFACTHYIINSVWSPVSRALYLHFYCSFVVVTFIFHILSLQLKSTQWMCTPAMYLVRVRMLMYSVLYLVIRATPARENSIKWNLHRQVWESACKCNVSSRLRGRQGEKREMLSKFRLLSWICSRYMYDNNNWWSLELIWLCNHFSSIEPGFQLHNCFLTYIFIDNPSDHFFRNKHCQVLEKMLEYVLAKFKSMLFWDNSALLISFYSVMCFTWR